MEDMDDIEDIDMPELIMELMEDMELMLIEVTDIADIDDIEETDIIDEADMDMPDMLILEELIIEDAFTLLLEELHAEQSPIFIAACRAFILACWSLRNVRMRERLSLPCDVRRSLMRALRSAARCLLKVASACTQAFLPAVSPLPLARAAEPAAKVSDPTRAALRRRRG